MPKSPIFPAALILWVVTGARLAVANPRPLPMTYGSETTAAGSWEVEQYADFTPLRALSTATGDPAWYGALSLQTEIEYGLTDRLELGLYVTLAPEPGEGFSSTAVLPTRNGLKQRLRYRLADTGQWPVDVAFYGEVVEAQDEAEFEAKVILQRRLGLVRLVANLSGEREFYFAGRDEWVLNPSAGVTVELTPRYHVGAETWWWAEFPVPAPSSRAFNLGPHGYVGPAFLASWKNFWWSTGAYLRVTDSSHTLRPGDAFGQVSFRTVIGLGF